MFNFNPNKKYAVVGLGITGLSSIQFLLSQGSRVTAYEPNATSLHITYIQAQYPNLPVKVGKLSLQDFKGIDIIVLSPGVPVAQQVFMEAKAAGIIIIGDLILFDAITTVPYVAITGSNGKSTVTSLVHHMTQYTYGEQYAGIGGNIGIPMLSLLNKPHRINVIELSSFQLELANGISPEASVVLNLSLDHMDRYVTFECYKAAKHRIYNGAKQVVYNREDAKTYPLHHDKVVSFGLDRPPSPNDYGLMVINGEEWLCKGDVKLIKVELIPLIGRQNIQNALAAIALGDCIGLPIEAMQHAIQTFKGLAHRCQFIVRHQDILWINDSKGSNVGATIASLSGVKNCISGQWILILGGRGKKTQYEDLLPYINPCKALIIMGEDQEKIFNIFHKHILCLKASDLDEVIQLAKQQAKPGDGVLLSPAATSWDMFKNFEDRGMQFMDKVCKSLQVGKYDQPAKSSLLF